MKVYFKILHEIVANNRKQTAICFSIMFVMSVLQVFIPLSMREMISRIEETASVKVFVLCVAVYAFMWLCYNVINVKWYKHLDILGEKVLWFLRKQIYHALWNCDYSVYSKFSKDYLKNVLFTDVISIYSNVILYSLNIIADLFMVLILLGVSFYVDAAITVVLLVTVGVGLGLSVLTKPVVAQCSMEVNKALKKDNAVSNECVDGMELIRTNGLYDYYKEKSKNSIRDFIRIAIKTDQKMVFLKNLTDHYHQVMLMVMTGVLLLTTQNAGAANLVYYMFVSNLIIDKSQAIENNFYQFMRNMAAFRNIDDIIHTPVTTCEGQADVGTVTEIRFDRAGLAYDNGRQVFKEVSFTLSKGDAVLIRGENGSGKSSILKMIAGLISPTSGDITYNGQSFFNINRQTLYKQICYLNQEELLLNETLKDYLSVMAHKDISQEDYGKYREQVGLTKDYGVITDNGKSFSGGEKKKAILMKLLARKDDVSVILLDETEAGLDLQSRQMMDAIEKELLEHKERYILVKITHWNTENAGGYNKVIELGKHS